MIDMNVKKVHINEPQRLELSPGILVVVGSGAAALNAADRLRYLRSIRYCVIVTEGHEYGPHPAILGSEI